MASLASKFTVCSDIGYNMCWQIPFGQLWLSVLPADVADRLKVFVNIMSLWCWSVKCTLLNSRLQQDRGFKYRSMSQRLYKMLAVGVLASRCGLEKYKQEYIEQIVGSLQALASCPLTKGRLSRGRTGPQTTGRTQQLFNRLETTLTSSSSSATVGVMVL